MNILARQLTERIQSRTAHVVIVGQGYVGLPLAMKAADTGMRVTGYDTSLRRVSMLRAGVSYVEDVPSAQIEAALLSGYTPTDQAQDIADFDIAVVTVPTPLKEGTPDLSFIEKAGQTLATYLRPGALTVLESTTYPGTTDEFFCPILEQSGLQAGKDFFLGYSPERIDPGNSIWTLENTPKVVSGINPESLRCIDAFYSTIVNKIIYTGSTAEAELVKLLENTFRHVNIALINELTMFANDLDINIWNAIDAASTKPFGFMRFTPGPGVGGHCLPVDPSYLAWRVHKSLGHTFRFVELANDINNHMPDYVVTRIAALLNRERKAINGSRILLLGMTYKASTSDWRESPSIAVAEKLTELGAEVRAHDPHLPIDTNIPFSVPLVSCTKTELETADLVILLVDHPNLPYDDIRNHSRILLDTKGRLRFEEFQGELL